MARVCTSCGLTTDAQGRLIVNTGSATWPYGTCIYSNGIPIVCGADGVLRLAEPHKEHVRTVQVSSPLPSAQVTSAQFGSPTVGGPNQVFGSPITKTLVNPSSCLPMTVAVRFGVQHTVWTKAGAGDSGTLIGATLSNDVTMVTADAHQQWRHNGTVSSLVNDTMNSTSVFMFTLAAGATVTFSLQPYINVVTYNGSTSLTNLQFVLDVDAWNN